MRPNLHRNDQVPHAYTLRYAAQVQAGRAQFATTCQAESALDNLAHAIACAVQLLLIQMHDQVARGVGAVPGLLQTL